MHRCAASLRQSLLMLSMLPMVALSQTGTITGRVREQSGEAIVGAQVSASRMGGAPTMATTRESGTFTITNLTPGTYRLQVTFLGFRPSFVDSVIVRAGAPATVDVQMIRTAVQIDAVVTTAGRGQAERVQESPNVISVVSSLKIAETPSVTVTDHLKAQPGLAIIQGGVAQANIVSRGFNNAFSTSMLMLQDYRFAGVPSLRVNVPFLFTGTPEDIDRIEVLQGPAAALYGPNSGNGVLHVITKSPFQSAGSSITLDAGERSLLRAGLRHSEVFNDRWALKLSGEALTAKDFEYVDPNEPLTYSATDQRIPQVRRGQAVRRNFDLSKQSAEARLDFRPSENTQLISSAGYSKIGSGMEITTTFGAAQVRNWSYLSLQERFQHKGFFAQAFYNQSNSGNESGTDPDGTFYLRTGIPVVDRSSILVGQAQQAASLWRTRLIFGGEYIATRPKTEGTINGRNEDDDAINEYGGYLQTTTEITPQLDLLLAARGDVNTRIEGAQFSPRAALIFEPVKDQNIRLTFNRAFNSPAAFSFFLDQYSGTTPAPGMPVQILGNPPKQGWTFARTCASGAGGGLCMRSPYIPGVLAPASAAAAFPGLVLALPQIVQGNPTLTDAARAQLLGLLNQLGPILRSLRPTDAQVGSVLYDVGTRTAITQPVTDYAPLGPGFANTWEAGYKGIFAKRVRFELAAWWQRRPAEPTTQIINPAVLLNPGQLGPYLGASIAQALVAQGMPPAQAQATAAQAAPALTQLMAAVPVGATAFTSPLYDQPYLVFTYRSATGHVNVSGQDLSADISMTPAWSLGLTYSHLSDNVFPDAPGATAANPLAANTPKHRGSATVRYERYQHERKGFSAEVRGRYADAYPVNSGVFNSYGIGVGARYEPVPVNAMLDANVSWILPYGRGARISLNGSNILNNKVRTFVGVPEIGRMLSTRLQYNF